MPLKDPLRRLPSSVTTFNVSDMIAPLHHDSRTDRSVEGEDVYKRQVRIAAEHSGARGFREE